MMYVFEYEMTSNRVDCFSVIGIAREAAATFRKGIPSPGGNADRKQRECSRIILKSR